MNDRAFLDTNVIVYAFDSAAGAKQKTAQRLLRDALTERNAIVSAQVIAEFSNVALRKFAVPLTSLECAQVFDDVLGPLCEVATTVGLIRLALGVRTETSFSFYDSLIIAAAIEGQCTKLISEDMQAGRTVRGVKIQNPFAK